MASVNTITDLEKSCINNIDQTTQIDGSLVPSTSLSSSSSLPVRSVKQAPGRGKTKMVAGPVISGDVQRYNGRITWFLVLSSMVAATGGIIFGYDIGISGFCFFFLCLICTYTYIFLFCNYHFIRLCRWSNFYGIIFEEILSGSL